MPAIRGTRQDDPSRTDPTGHLPAGRPKGPGAERAMGSDGGVRGMRSPATVKSADRVVTLFELLGRWGREMSHAEIAEVMAIPKSSLSQLLKNLVARGWLAYSPETKGYLLGDAIITIARGAAQTHDVIGLSGPVLAELTAATNETSAFNVLRGDWAETVATVLGRETLLAVMRLGERAPLYTTSYGKAMLAYLSVDMQEDYLARVELLPVTPRTIRSTEELRLQLRTIRRDGIAYSFEEHVPGIVGTARPVVGPNGNVLGAISIATAAIRYDTWLRERISDAIERAVTTLSQHVHHMALQVEDASTGPTPAKSDKQHGKPDR
jgi:DNA-binding IclR family transcriptional regulator